MRRLLLLLVVAFSCAVWADTTALTVTPGSDFFSGHSNYDLGGYEFTTSSNIDVTQLGLLVGSPGNQFANAAAQDHLVGIYTTGGTLLGSATISAGSALDANGFAWVTLGTPIDLTAGDYVVAALYNQGSADGFYAGDFGNNGKSMAAGLTFDQAWIWYNGFSPIDPNNPNGTAGLFTEGNSIRSAYIGPNFQFTAAPEPASLALLASGILGLGMLRRKR